MPALGEWLEKKPFTLTLSSGYFSFFAHCGVLATLEENRIYPANITGASAGALAGTCWASGCSAGLLKETLTELTRQDFWDPAPGMGLLKGERFRNFLTELCPVAKLESCRIPISLSVFDLYSRSTHILKQGPLSHCVYASCCVPLLFQPIRINQRIYFDGGIKDPSGLAGVKKCARVFHHSIPSAWTPRSNHKEPRVEQTNNRIIITIPGLDRVSPRRLDKGKRAFTKGSEGMKRALDYCIKEQ